jgi:hypothetical protein
MCEQEFGNAHFGRVHPVLLGPVQPSSYFDVPPGIKLKKFRIFFLLYVQQQFLYGDWRPATGDRRPATGF